MQGQEHRPLCSLCQCSAPSGGPRPHLAGLRSPPGPQEGLASHRCLSRPHPVGVRLCARSLQSHSHMLHMHMLTHSCTCAHTHLRSQTHTLTQSFLCKSLTHGAPNTHIFSKSVTLLPHLSECWRPVEGSKPFRTRPVPRLCLGSTPRDIPALCPGPLSRDEVRTPYQSAPLPLL